jgi:hypothetical protein
MDKFLAQFEFSQEKILAHKAFLPVFRNYLKKQLNDEPIECVRE